MIRWSPVPLAVLAALTASTGEPPARAADAAVTSSAPPAPNRFALSVAGGSGGAPLGHFGLRLAFRRGRLEASAGVGIFFGADPTSEDSSGKSPTDLTHVVPSLGGRYSVFHRARFDLLPGLGLSLQPLHYEDDVTRPSYDSVRFTWQSSEALRLDVDLEARLSLGGSWFVSGVIGWGVFVAGLGDCNGETAGFMFSCRQPPSPAYAAPTPIAGLPYGQLFVGRQF
jgi:hypothetical protein